MPLRDHFHPPFTDDHSWDVVHGGLPKDIATALNRILPANYIAGPKVYLRSGLEIDIAAFQKDPPDEESTGGSGGGGTATATAVWVPVKPSLTVAADWSNVDEYEVLIYDSKRRRELVAAIELVSPSNKDRPDSRRLFVNKCAGLLQAGVSVTIVDVVTEYTANLYAELLEAVGQSDPAITIPPQPIYAVACRSRAAKQGQALETWYRPLAIGQPLPQLPIWLTDRLAVPFDLEPIYEGTLKDLKIT